MRHILNTLSKDKRLSVVWLAVRVWLGFQWLTAGLHKFSNPAWVGDQAGTAIKGFWLKGAGLAVGPDGAMLPAGAKYSWYQEFLKFLIDTGAEKWFTWAIVVGEVAVGVALVFGAFTALAAIGGALMNLNFMLAGTASSNPVLYTLAILLIIAGANAGYYGLDRVLSGWQGFRGLLPGTKAVVKTAARTS